MRDISINTLHRDDDDDDDNNNNNNNINNNMIYIATRFSPSVQAIGTVLYISYLHMLSNIERP